MNKAGPALVLVLASAGCFFNSHNITIRIERSSLQKTPDYVQNIEILLGAELTLVIHSNGTTGYLWTDPAELSDPEVLDQTAHRYVIRPDANAGEAGHEVFTLATRSRGTCSVNLEYRRPSDGDVAYTCTINVEVK